MKKNICLVLDQFLYGGIERVAINYLKNIDKEKYNVNVIILSDVEDMIKQIPEYCNVIRINIPRYNNPLSRASTMVRRRAGAILYYGTYLLKKFFIYLIDYFNTRFLRKIKYDVAIAFSGHLNDIYVVLDCIKADKKIVWAHGMIYQYLLLSPAFEKMYSRFDKIVSINHIDQNDIFTCKPYLNYKIEKLYNPVILDASCLSDNIEEVKEKYGDFILTVARMDEPKDFLTLLDAYEILLNKFKIKYNLVIVGDGPDRKKIEKYISKKKINNRVFLVGSQSDVDKFYRNAKLFVLSSKSEGLPTVIIEAMSRGLPIVATDAPYGCRDILNNNEYGIITPVGDALFMAKKVNELLKDKKLFDYYCEQSLKRYNDFLPEKIMKEFYRIIECDYE